MTPTTLAAFADEVEKIAAALGRWSVSKTRAGKRPLRVLTMLRKDREGSLLKHSGVIDVLSGAPDPGAARPPRRKGEVPSREDQEAGTRREDRREFAATILSPTAVVGDVGANNPVERTY